MGNEKSSPRTRPVHCKSCGTFICGIAVTMQNPPVGHVGMITDLKCWKCKKTMQVLLGVADKDRRGDIQKVENLIRGTI